jgi:hypothetical protein
MDTYGAGFNAIQGSLAPRRFMNPQTGVVDSSFANITGNAIFRRLQVRIDDMNPVNWPGALFFVEGQYVCTEDAAANNDTNNASYARVTLDGTYTMTAQGALNISKPAIYAWRDHGGGAGIPDPNVAIQSVEIFGLPGQPPAGEGGSGFVLVGCRVTQIGKLWHYEYAVQNLTSARGVGAFNVPIPDGATVSNIGFHDAWYHDEDAVYDGTDWATPLNTYQARWECTQTYAQNVNANALRYGTIYNFWFDCDVPPIDSQVELEMFNPGAGCVPQKVTAAVKAPGAFMAADIARDGEVNADDLMEVVLDWGACPCQYTCDSDVDDNNAVDTDDLIRVILDWTK